MSLVRSRFGQLPDEGKGGNNQKYAVLDAAISAFAVFFMQSASFLAQQREMQVRKGRDNAQSLFGVHQIPSDNQIRNLLDPVAPARVSEVFWAVYGELVQAGVLATHVGIDGNWLCGLDGTQYFSSQRTIATSVRTSKRVRRPAIVTPSSLLCWWRPATTT